MFIHNIIKIKYIHEGYLPDYPYNMITDGEMFDAFMRDDQGFFNNTYPCPDDSLIQEYNELKECIFLHISKHQTEGTPLGSWVYSYMLGNAIGPSSDEADISYVNELLNIDSPTEVIYSKDTAEAVYEVSTLWLQKMSHKTDGKVPTMFAEPYIVKSLRLQDVDVLGG